MLSHNNYLKNIYARGVGDLQRKKEYTRKLYEKISDVLDVPQDMVARVPVFIIRGRHEIEVCGCRGILEYGKEKVVLSMGKEMFCVMGKNLTLSDFRDDTLFVRGWIRSAEYADGER